MIAVRISDNGEGIPAEDIERIFEPFYTTKAAGKGTGLGLSQVYGFVKQSDGEIDVQSREGEGTIFTIRFAKSAAPRLPSQTLDEEQRGVPHGSGRVLIVEDNAAVGDFAAALLDDLGFETSLAPNAQEALDQLARDSGGYDVIFSDVVMPGMGGIEFAKVVQERWPAVPVVLTSGYSHVLAENSARGFPLLQKPYSAESLSQAIRTARRRAT
jgi:CheY-like chemotaxis protein